MSTTVGSGNRKAYSIYLNNQFLYPFCVRALRAVAENVRVFLFANRPQNLRYLGYASAGFGGQYLVLFGCQNCEHPSVKFCTSVFFGFW